MVHKAQGRALPNKISQMFCKLIDFILILHQKVKEEIERHFNFQVIPNYVIDESKIVINDENPNSTELKGLFLLYFKI